MPVVNTTYNFNQPNVNFGQSLLYGMFGSLTGGMGCFGGGYGLGGFGLGGYGMGMGGSLFSMMGMGMGMGGYGYGCGFGGFGMGCYSDSMIGMQIGNSIIQSTLYCVSRALEGRGGNGNNESTSSKIADVKSRASKHLSILNLNSIAQFNPSLSADKYSVVSDLKVTQASAQKAYDEAKLSKENKEIELKGSFPDGEPKSTDAKYSSIGKEAADKLKASNPNATEAELKKASDDAINAAWKKDYTAYKKLKDELDAAEKLETEKKSELDSAKSKVEEKTKEVKSSIDALKPLKEEYDELVAQEKAENEAKVYDDADGNWLNRASKSSVEEYKGGTCTKSQVRKAFNLFIEAKNSGKKTDAKNWANKIKLMHFSNQYLFDNTFATAYDQVEEWLSKN